LHVLGHLRLLHHHPMLHLCLVCGHHLGHLLGHLIGHLLLLPLLLFHTLLDRG
jgi:hypothetical protein